MGEAWIRREAVANHRSWLAARASAKQGERVRLSGLSTALVPGGEATLPFPALASANAGKVLDAWMDSARSAGAGCAAVWSATAEGPPGLGPRLVARGFEIGWQPHWMGIDTEALADVRAVDGVQVDEEDDGISVPDLPYRDAIEAEASARLVSNPVHSCRRWVARHRNRVIGQVLAHRRPDRPEIAGIYNMGVVPDWRRRGVARMLLARLLSEMRGDGVHRAILNSAASSFYFRIGFRTGGFGRTWWCHAAVFESGPVPADLVRWGEAIGLGEVHRLDALHGVGAVSRNCDTVLPAGMSPMDLAVHYRRTAVVDWLEAHGATLTITQAWRIGGRRRAVELLRRHPERLHFLEGPFRATPLHIAVEDDDTERMGFLIAHGADTTLRDGRFDSTPLGWARHLGRIGAETLLVGAGASA